MSDHPAVSTAPPAPQGGGWTRNRFVFFIAAALLLHLALIFIFGTKKQIVPRAVGQVPHLQLADKTDEFIAFSDPTLFARPNTHDLVTLFWRHPPVPPAPDFNWTEAPRYLPPAREKFSAVFHEFMPASQPAETPLDFKPEPILIAPVVTFDDLLTSATTMQITGELVQRPLLTAVALPSLPWNDVIAPSKVQALVDPAGNVASAVLLPLDSDLEAADSAAIGDSNALVIARSLRFAPAPGLTFGEIIFHWHTVPTNAP
jgi:hypothetical protein